MKLRIIPTWVAPRRGRGGLGVVGAALVASGCVVVSTTSTSPATDAARPSTDAGPRVEVGADATRRVLAALGRDVVLADVRRFAEAATALEAACAAAAAAPTDPARAAAQAAWTDAMDAWQSLEVMQIGPAAMMGTAASPGAIGGRDLRDAIDAWPLVNRCRIDQETVAGDYGDVDAFAGETVNVRGLPALEYLLFVEGATNGCAGSAAINASGTWAALGDEGVRARRAAYAATLATLVRRAADALRAAWEPSGEDWAGQLGRAGAGASAYASAQSALNAVTDAMFYLDTVTKDMKVAGPAALGDTCASSSCPDLLESRWAVRSREHIVANLRAFERLFLGAAPGSDAPGIDDLLASVGAGGTAERMASALASAIDAAEALPTLDAAGLAASLDAMATLYARLRAISDLLKTEVVTVLDLELPESAATDND